MKHTNTLLSLLLFCFSSGLTYGQSLTKIKQLILQSDSVILTSHISPPQIISKNDDPNDQKVVLNNKINPKLIKEQKIISDSSRKYLAHFITKPFRDNLIEEGKCFIPHHTIYIFKKSKISWINICFLCGEIECSTDIKFPEEDFDQATWKKLSEFFKSQGFKYGFDTDDL